jgi:hypothetical protein
MTDPTPPPPLTDEDLCAVIDGEARSELLERVAADADAQARLAQLRAASTAVAGATVPPLAPAVADSLITRALAAADGVDEPQTQDPAVVPIPRGRRLPPTWLVAAAVLVLVAIGVGLIVAGSGNHTSSTDATTALGASSHSAEKSAGADSTSAGSTGAGRSPSTGGAAATTTRPNQTPALDNGLTVDASGVGPILDYGRFGDSDALRKAFATSWAAGARHGGTPEETVSAKSAERCGEQVASLLSLRVGPDHIATAKVGSEPVLIYEFPAKASSDGRATVAAVSVATCAPVVIFER